MFLIKSLNGFSYPLELEVGLGAGTTISIYLNDSDCSIAGTCLLVIYFGFFFLQKVDVEKWVRVSMDLQRNCDLNTCTFAVASNIFCVASWCGLYY